MTMNKSEKRDLLLFDDSPPAGHPDCRCSRCGKTIYELPVSRYYCPELKKELRFHRRCAGLMLKSGQMRASMGRSDGEKKTIGSVVKAALARMGFTICRIVRLVTPAGARKAYPSAIGCSKSPMHGRRREHP